ncbi:sulfotransferase family protein [Nonomuraea rhizosphaerae]|uniref:sulfotransferase family protein n=1 Tax=Nonomuraea rhizosphaerae TaxID=2665663 RepID=UPI001C5E265C|nr:sulfotransferase [Nonomuraea rhizosphaerae]
MSLPDFLIAGVPKAGTTALHSALQQHPDLYLSAIKEPKFFLTDGPPPAEGGPGDAATYQEHVWRRSDYEALFAGAPPGALTGESTPFYLYDLDAQRRIHAAVPRVKLVVTLRDPVERAHSNWTHLWSAGLEPIGDLVRACEAEPGRIAEGWAHFWHYVALGRYGEQLAHLFELFPREQVLVFRYRDLVDRPAETLDRICAFLGVRQGLLTELPRQNVTAHPEVGARHAMLSSLRRRLPGFLADPIEGLLQQRGAARRPLSWDQRERLISHFAEDIGLLQRVTGEDYSDWLRPRERSGGLVGARPPGQRQSRNGRRT